MISEKIVTNWVNKNSKLCIEFLQRLISTDTAVIGHGVTGGKEKEGQEIIATKLQKLGLEIDVFEPNDNRLRRYKEAEGNLGHDYTNRPNVVGILKGKRGGRSLILNGHIDTMPPNYLQTWKSNPFIPTIKGKKLFGLGSCDMKGGLAAIIMAVECIVKSQLDLEGEVIVESVVDEEGGGNGTLACCDRGYSAKAAVISEPTQLQIFSQGMGFLLFEVRVVGKAVHAGMSSEGVNAIKKAMKLINALQALQENGFADNKCTLPVGANINLGEIHGGVAGSTVPGNCTFKICAHFLPIDGHNGKTLIERQILGAISFASRHDRWLSGHPVEVNKYQEGSAWKTDPNHPIVQTMSNSFRGALGKFPVVGKAPYGCDARILNQIAHTPTVVFGPGNIKNAHGPNELIDIGEYLDSIKILALTILKWTSSYT